MIRKESVAVINESVSASPLSDRVLSTVTSHVNSHLRNLLLTASKFSRHSLRPSLLPDDIDAALRLLGQPPVYGYRGAGLRGEGAVWKAAGDDVYYVEDEVVDFTAVLSRPLPPPPVDCSVSVHWMAIEGVAPALPHNAADDAKQSEPSSQCPHSVASLCRRLSRADHLSPWWL